MLGNLGTLPWYQRREAASTLVRWWFERADKDGFSVFLDTDLDGQGRPLYERLGFERVGEAVLDLAKYGGTGTHTHIGMLREPRTPQS